MASGSPLGRFSRNSPARVAIQVAATRGGILVELFLHRNEFVRRSKTAKL
jgi:hypothetical protein